VDSERERRKADRKPDPVDGGERCDRKRAELQPRKVVGHG
jgi:hypothetical protein